MNAVFSRYPNGGGELNLALVLADNADDHGQHIRKPVPWLASRSRQSDRAVQNQLRKMERDGWLILVAKEDRVTNTPREYRINPVWLAGGVIESRAIQGPEDAPEDALGGGADSAPPPGEKSAPPGAEIAPPPGADSAPGVVQNLHPKAFSLLAKTPRAGAPAHEHASAGERAQAREGPGPLDAEQVVQALIRNAGIPDHRCKRDNDRLRIASWIAQGITGAVLAESIRLGRERKGREPLSTGYLDRIIGDKLRPKPPRPVPLARGAEAQNATAAWLEVRNAIRTGSKPKGGWADPRTDAALSRMGGFQLLGEKTSRELDFKAKEFAEFFNNRGNT